MEQTQRGKMCHEGDLAAQWRDRGRLASGDCFGSWQPFRCRVKPEKENSFSGALVGLLSLGTTRAWTTVDIPGPVGGSWSSHGRLFVRMLWSIPLMLLSDVMSPVFSSRSHVLSPLLESQLGDVPCFGQWAIHKCDASGGLKPSFVWGLPSLWLWLEWKRGCEWAWAHLLKSPHGKPKHPSPKIDNC